MSRLWTRSLRLILSRSPTYPAKHLRGQVRTYEHPMWRPAFHLDKFVEKEARPISLRQLMVFGRTLTEERLISSANYVRTELPIRLAHRVRDLQNLPYVVVTNPHIAKVYDMYFKAFDRLRRIPEIKTLADNEKFCETISETLQEHLTVIPKLAMGVLECQELMNPDDMDKFMNTILRSRISRRVIAEQQLALTETFNNRHSPEEANQQSDFVGGILVNCRASDVITRIGDEVAALVSDSYGSSIVLPTVKLSGNVHATFPYMLSHYEYIIGELLRNSFQAVVEHHHNRPKSELPPPVEVTIVEANQHVIIRVSDQGGGIPRDILPHIWSFSKGPRSRQRLENLTQVPKMSATFADLRAGAVHKFPSHYKQSTSSPLAPSSSPSGNPNTSTTAPPVPQTEPSSTTHDNSLSSLSGRPPDLRLGMGLPLSRVYAEYWAGGLEVHSLEGFGVDAFLQISKLGNKNEQLTMRATIDAV